MKMGDMRAVLRAWVSAGLCALLSLPATAQTYVERYPLSPGSPSLDVGVQPLSYPPGVIGAVMRRDRVLQAALAALGHPMKAYAFNRGGDMVGLLNERRLEAAFLGDISALMAAASGRVWIVGLARQSATAIVARGGTSLRDLVGKRVGCVPLSSGHHALLQGLATTGISDKDVNLVPLTLDEMPEALARADIDAFVAAEPAPTAALQRSERHRVIFRGVTTDYFVIERQFEAAEPEAARALVAGFVRALEWMRRSHTHLDKAARWVRVDGEAFSGKAPALSPAQVGAIARREILNVPSAPVILSSPDDSPPLKNEFDFLMQKGLLPAQSQWAPVQEALGYDGLRRVMADPRGHGLQVFDYAE